jgi:hypothetical protein
VLLATGSDLEARGEKNTRYRVLLWAIKQREIAPGFERILCSFHCFTDSDTVANPVYEHNFEYDESVT